MTPGNDHFRLPRVSVSTGGERSEEVARCAVVDWAMAQVGVTSSSRAELIDAWQREFGLEGLDWCGCFVGYALRHAGGVDDIDGRVVWVPCVLADARSGEHGWRTLLDPEGATPGDAVLYCWDESGVPGHIGLVIENSPEEGTLTAVEGNTTSGDVGDQARGGGVYMRTRPYTAVVSCAVPRYR